MNEVELDVAGGAIAVSVARRMARALGACADLSIDRIDDATLVCELMLADRDDDRRARLRFIVRGDGLEIVFLAADPDVAVPGLGGLVGRLADEVWTGPDGRLGGAYLHVLLGRDRGRRDTTPRER